MKVVIPSIHCRDKKMVFSTPRDEFWISWRDIWGGWTWDRYLQAPKLHLVISHTYSLHVLTKVAQRSNFDVFEQFLNSCSQDWKWNKHHKFDTSSCVQMFENIQNILFTFFDIFSLILCYFWRQKCFETYLPGPSSYCSDSQARET